MRRGLLILLCLLAVTWFEFQVYPGHSYLQGDTQLLVPMLERLDTPGFLSRDLVAANPVFTFTIYDEFTQFLHAQGHLSFEQALLRQQIVFRFAGILGVFLLARSLKTAPFASVALSATVNAATQLTAPHAFVTNPEATPVAFAFPLVLLAGGLLSNRKPLLASLAAGLALLYDPLTSIPFWLVVIGASLSDRPLRKFLRPVWPALLIFGLVLGNLVQLQAGLGGDQDLTSKMTAAMVRLTQIRTPWTWVSSWLSTEIWSYLFLLVAAAWALTRVWKQTDRLVNWVVIGLAGSGLFGVVMAMILLASRRQMATAMPAARMLALTVALCALVCGVASFQAAAQHRWRESLCWAALLIAAVLNAQVLDLLHLNAATVARPAGTDPNLRNLAAWAEETWGSSMFQFPDAAQRTEPGTFRALSRRALWADWQSGRIADYSNQAGQTWWSRWQSSMSQGYSTDLLQETLRQPIDYYVLRREHQLTGIKPTYSNSEFVVYDAQDLREAREPLTQMERPDK
jgi:hypothetical protein